MKKQGSWRLYKRKGSGTYWMDIRACGHRIRESAGTADRREAESKARAKLAELAEFYAVDRTSIGMVSAFERFMSHCQEHKLALNTIKDYRLRVGRFVSEHAEEGVGRLTEDRAFKLVAQYLSRRAKEVKSITHDRVPIGTFFNYLHYKRWYKGENPAGSKLHSVRCPRQKIEKPNRRTTLEEDLVLRGEGMKTELGALILLTRWCGLRRGRITFNDLRASFVSDCYERGLSPELENRIAGHSVAVAEEHYLEWRMKQSTNLLPDDPLKGHSDNDADPDAGMAVGGAQ